MKKLEETTMELQKKFIEEVRAESREDRKNDRAL